MNFIKKYLIETKKIAEKIDTKAISKILNRIKKTKNQKDVFFF
jgi:DNA-binding TFAR19-related protein (PDSD5 family)